MIPSSAGVFLAGMNGDGTFSIPGVDLSEANIESIRAKQLERTREELRGMLMTIGMHKADVDSVISNEHMEMLMSLSATFGAVKVSVVGETMNMRGKISQAAIRDCHMTVIAPRMARNAIAVFKDTSRRSNEIRKVRRMTASESAAFARHLKTVALASPKDPESTVRALYGEVPDESVMSSAPSRLGDAFLEQVLEHDPKRDDAEAREARKYFDDPTESAIENLRGYMRSTGTIDPGVVQSAMIFEAFTRFRRNLEARGAASGSKGDEPPGDTWRSWVKGIMEDPVGATGDAADATLRGVSQFAHTFTDATHKGKNWILQTVTGASSDGSHGARKEASPYRIFDDSTPPPVEPAAEESGTTSPAGGASKGGEEDATASPDEVYGVIDVVGRAFQGKGGTVGIEGVNVVDPRLLLKVVGEAKNPVDRVLELANEVDDETGEVRKHVANLVYTAILGASGTRVSKSLAVLARIKAEFPSLALPAGGVEEATKAAVSPGFFAALEAVKPYMGAGGAVVALLPFVNQTTLHRHVGSEMIPLMSFLTPLVMLLNRDVNAVMLMNLIGVATSLAWDSYLARSFSHPPAVQRLIREQTEEELMEQQAIMHLLDSSGAAQAKAGSATGDRGAAKSSHVYDLILAKSMPITVDMQALIPNDDDVVPASKIKRIQAKVSQYYREHQQKSTESDTRRKQFVKFHQIPDYVRKINETDAAYLIAPSDKVGEGKFDPCYVWTRSTDQLYVCFGPSLGVVTCCAPVAHLASKEPPEDPVAYRNGNEVAIRLFLVGRPLYTWNIGIRTFAELCRDYYTVTTVPYKDEEQTRYHRKESVPTSVPFKLPPGRPPYAWRAEFEWGDNRFLVEGVKGRVACATADESPDSSRWRRSITKRRCVEWARRTFHAAEPDSETGPCADVERESLFVVQCHVAVRITASSRGKACRLVLFSED